jgi:predicted DNA-binding protein YlxM (UPF0122 family)
MDELGFERRIRDSVSELDAWGELLTLSVRERAVLALTYWQDLTPAEVAERLDISESSVRRNLARSRARLQRFFATDELGSERRVRDVVNELIATAPVPIPSRFAEAARAKGVATPLDDSDADRQIEPSITVDEPTPNPTKERPVPKVSLSASGTRDEHVYWLPAVLVKVTTETGQTEDLQVTPVTAFDHEQREPNRQTAVSWQTSLSEFLMNRFPLERSEVDDLMEKFPKETDRMEFLSAREKWRPLPNPIVDWKVSPAPRPPRRCHNCGKWAPDEDGFCVNCGFFGAPEDDDLSDGD